MAAFLENILLMNEELDEEWRYFRDFESFVATLGESMTSLFGNTAVELVSSPRHFNVFNRLNLSRTKVCTAQSFQLSC